MQTASKTIPIGIEELVSNVRDPGPINHLFFVGQLYTLCGKRHEFGDGVPVDTKSRKCGVCVKVANSMGLLR